eukprot:12803266-Alexandrium_andersonii.AAC.1
MLPVEPVEARELEAAAEDEDPDEVVAAAEDGAPAALGPSAAPPEPAWTSRSPWSAGLPPPAKWRTRGSRPVPPSPDSGAGPEQGVAPLPSPAAAPPAESCTSLPQGGSATGGSLGTTTTAGAAQPAG